MITNYKINDQGVLIINLNYNYEFANLNYKEKPLLKQIKEIIKTINYKGKLVALATNGIVIATLLLNNNTNVDYNYKYVNKLIFNNNTITENIGKNITTNTIDNIDINKQTINVNLENANINNNIKEKQEQINIINSNENTNKNQIETIKNNIASNEEKKTTASISTQKNMISIYRNNGIVEKIEFEDYIIGVVAAEMPASFNEEALKAQAVIARTYALKKINSGQNLTDDSTTQNYIDLDQMQQKWGLEYEKYYNKIKKAVEDTKNLTIKYNNEYIDAVYHSTSNGKTEDSTAVWGNYFPYLVSVDSSWDSNTTPYLREIDIYKNEFDKKLGTNINKNSEIQIIKNNSNRVDSITIDDITLTGKEFRTKLGLRSTDFELVVENDNVKIITRGYGHGVGLSQYGANEMAKMGYTYEQIINHYYSGVYIEKIG